MADMQQSIDAVLMDEPGRRARGTPPGAEPTSKEAHFPRRRPGGVRLRDRRDAVDLDVKAAWPLGHDDEDPRR